MQLPRLNLLRPEMVVVTGFEELTSLFCKLRACPGSANQIGTLEYIDGSGDDAGRRTDGARGTTRRAQCDTEMTYIIEQITQRGQLKSFKWSDEHQGCDEVEPRSASFWNALAGAATTLRHLSLRLGQQELPSLCDYPLFPCPFPELLTLDLDLTQCHGNDGSEVHQLLHSTQKLTSLSLRMPFCDLENCRLEGLTYDYHLPNLSSLTLHGWLEPTAGLANFFVRHPSLTSLSCSLLSDDEDALQIPPTALPNLRCLAFHNQWAFEDVLSDLLSPSSSRKVTHLRLGRLNKRYLSIVAGAGQSLHCLELECDDIHRWREDPAVLPIGKLLPSLPELLELAIDCQTRAISWPNESGEQVKPEHLNADDLARLLSILPSTTKIRAVRMSDHNGLPLPADFLADLSNIAPPSLEYIRWDISGKQLLYQLENKADTRIEAKECEPLRPKPTSSIGDAWAGESVFDHAI